MENAGRAVADEICARFGSGSQVAVYCGLGRNGGDGMVVARHLAGHGFKVNLKLVGNSKTITDSIVIQNWLALKSMPVSAKLEEYRDSSNVSESVSDIIIDAVLGTGVKGKLRQPILRAVEAINGSRGFKIAVDAPTGVDSDTGEVLSEAVRANLTITFHAMKDGLLKAKDYCGELKVVSIGIPPEASLFVGPGDVEAAIVQRSPESHKGQYGRLLVIGGSETYSGAPALVALAAYRAGTDLVFVAAPNETAQTISAISPNLITIKLPGENLTPPHIRILRDEIAKADAIIIGPGLNMSRQSVSVVRRLLPIVRSGKKPLLLDADGLKAIGVVNKRLFEGPVVLTPHAGEFQAISGKLPSRDLSVRSTEVRTFAAKVGAVVLLKGHTDVISDGDRVKLNSTGNPGMTVGGTGDVLSGLVAGLMAQGVDCYRAAVAGAFVNGCAGDLAQEHLGNHLTATDLLDQIPPAMNDPMCHKIVLQKRLK
jgi:NAD(P)H-hydrate epimerase